MRCGPAAPDGYHHPAPGVAGRESVRGGDAGFHHSRPFGIRPGFPEGLSELAHSLSPGRGRKAGSAEIHRTAAPTRSGPCLRTPLRVNVEARGARKGAIEVTDLPTGAR